MTPRRLRRFLWPALAVLVAGLAWWWDRREDRRPAPRAAPPAAVPMPAPTDPNPMRMTPIPPRSPPGSPPGMAPETPPGR